MATAACLLLSGIGNASADDASNSNSEQRDRLHVIMHKNPGCACCDKWADHMRSYGFSVTNVEDPQLFAFKKEQKIPQPLMSCHTAMVGGYFVEGHVPANDVLRLLREKPEHVSGIAVPAMPLGSPGMEHSQPQAFKTVALLTDGSAYVFEAHDAGEDFSKADEATSSPTPVQDQQ